MDRYAKKIIYTVLILFLVVLVTIGFNANAENRKVSALFTEFKFNNAGTGYDSKSTTSFLQEENGFTNQIVDDKDSMVVASGDTVSYHVNASTSMAMTKRAISYVFTVPSEMELVSNVDDFCGVDKEDGFDSDIEYANREASFTNQQIKCTYYIKARATYEPFGFTGRDLVFKLTNNEGKIINVDHIKAEIIEGNNSVKVSPDNTEENIRLVSAPAYDIKIVQGNNGAVNPSKIGIYTDKDSSEIKSIALPKGGQFIVKPYDMKYSGYDSNKGYAKRTKWSAKVDVSASNFPEGTVFKIDGKVVEPVDGKLVIDKNNKDEVKIDFILPYEQMFLDKYGVDALSENRLKEIGKQALDEFFDGIIGQGQYKDGKYIGGSNLSLSAKLEVDEDSFKTPDFDNVNNKPLPGVNEGPEFSTDKIEIDGVKFASDKGQGSFNNNKYNGFEFIRLPDEQLVQAVPANKECTEATPQYCDIEKDHEKPNKNLTADNVIYRPWADNSTNFEENRVLYDKSSKEVSSKSGGNASKVIMGNEFKPELTFKTNNFFKSRGDVNSALYKDNALVLLDEFDYREMQLTGYPTNIKYPNEYKEGACALALIDNDECIKDKIVVQVGFNKTHKDVMDSIADSGWETIDENFNGSQWNKLVKANQKKSESNKNIASIRIIFKDAVSQPDKEYTHTYEVKDNDKTTKYTLSYKGEQIYGPKYAPVNNSDAQIKQTQTTYSAKMPMKIIGEPTNSVCVDGDNLTTFCTMMYSNIYNGEDAEAELSVYPKPANIIYLTKIDPSIKIDSVIKRSNLSNYGKNANITSVNNMGIDVKLSPKIITPMSLDDEFEPELKVTIDACIYDFSIKEGDTLNGFWKVSGKREYRCDQRDEENSETVFTLTADKFIKIRDAVDGGLFKDDVYSFKDIDFKAKVSQLASNEGPLKIDTEMKIVAYKLLSDSYSKTENSDYIESKNSSVTATVNLTSNAMNSIMEKDEFVERNQPLRYQSKTKVYDEDGVFSKPGTSGYRAASNVIVLPSRGHDYTYANHLIKDYLLAGGLIKSQFNGDYILSDVSLDIDNTTFGTTVSCTTDPLPNIKLDYDASDNSVIDNYDSSYDALHWINLNDSKNSSWHSGSTKSIKEECQNATALKITQPTAKKISDKEDYEIIRSLALVDIELQPKGNKVNDNYLMWLSKNQSNQELTNKSNTRDDSVEGSEASSYPTPANIEVVARSLSGHVYWANSKEDVTYKETSKGWSDDNILVELYEVDNNDDRLNNGDRVAWTKVDKFGNYQFDRYGDNATDNKSNDENVKYLKPGNYQVEITYPKQTKFENDKKIEVENLYRAYSKANDLADNCDNGMCTITTVNIGSKDGSISFGDELSSDIAITNIDFGFFGVNPVVDIMKAPVLPNCTDKDECTINWIIAAKNDGINPLTEVEIVDTMSKEVEIESVKYCRINSGGTIGSEDECDFIPAFSKSNKQKALTDLNIGKIDLVKTNEEKTNDDAAVKRTYKLDETKSEFNPNDKIFIEFSTKVSRKKAEGAELGKVEHGFNVGNQVYINTKETTEFEPSFKVEPSFDLATLPAVDKFNPLVAGKWTGNDSCSATDDWETVGDQCDQVYAGIPEVGNVGYLEGNVWDSIHDNRSNYLKNKDKLVKGAKVEISLINDNNIGDLDLANLVARQNELLETKTTEENGYYYFDSLIPSDKYQVKISYDGKTKGGYYYAFVDAADKEQCPGENLSCIIPMKQNVDNATSGKRANEAIKGGTIDDIKVEAFTLTKHINAGIYQEKTIVSTKEPSLKTTEVKCEEAPGVNLPSLEGIEWDVYHNKDKFEYIVTAKPKEGYKIDKNQQTQWVLKYTVTICPIIEEPKLSEVDCDKVPSVIVKEQAGIEWVIKHNKLNHSYTITAKPKDGYVFAQNAKTQWVLNYQIVACSDLENNSSNNKVPSTGNNDLIMVISLLSLASVMGISRIIRKNN